MEKEVVSDEQESQDETESDSNLDSDTEDKVNETTPRG